MTQLLFYISLISLPNPSFLSLVPPPLCDNVKQYSWKIDKKDVCCDTCPPGTYLDKRCSANRPTVCLPCGADQYQDGYGVLLTCNFCDECSTSQLKSTCNGTHNTVCGCSPGFKCKGNLCHNCEAIPTIKETTPGHNHTITAVTTRGVTQPGTDGMKWLLVFGMCLICVGILFNVTRLRPFLRWIKSKQGFCEPEPTHTEEQDVPLPVQEVSGNGKCDQSEV
ncbi:tumor necrosis factor receptor superfamily member 6B [Polymixia lowei]